METNNITEDYVSFETAKLLKEKGFKGGCFAAYNGNGKFYEFDEEVNDNDNVPCWSDAPTLQMAMKWLRRVHNIIPIILTGDNRHDGVIIYYWFRIDTIKNGRWKDAVYREDEIEYPTYEQACEASIRYCLENLI